MILELTKENLQNAGYDEIEVNQLYNTATTYTLQGTKGKIFVSKPENKFYTEIDFYRKTYLQNGELIFPLKCPDLISEYFDLALAKFLQNQQKLLGGIYNKEHQFNQFILLEISRSEIVIKNNKALIEKVGHWRLNNKEKDIQICEAYIDFIKNKVLTTEQPKQQTEINSYSKSYNQISFDEVSNKRKVDQSLNNWYLGDFFNEWLNDINKSINSYKYFDIDTIDKLREYNKDLCDLGTSLIKLYKVLSISTSDAEINSNIAFHLQEEQVLKNLEVIKFYNDFIKSTVRKNEYKKGNNFKEYCLDLLNNFTYNLNHILTIDVYKSPLKILFEDLKKSFTDSINLEELSLLNQLDRQNNSPKEEINILLKLNLQLDYFYGRISLAIMLNQRVHFLICSDENLFDIQKLKQYFINNTLNDFAKSEADKFVELTNELKILDQKYSSLPNPLIIHQYEYQNSRGGTNSGSARGALEYYHYHDNEISHLTESGFKNRSQKSKNIFSLNTNQLFYKCKDIQDLCIMNRQPQQNENSLSIAVKKEDVHNHIFKDNAFAVWESMFVEFDINESSRTDVKFMFEEMKKEGLIHKTVNQTTFLEWITLTYDGLIVQKTSNHSRSSERVKAYSRAKELYKS
ncbi:hypothetical protein H8R23_13685 [Flavobacterium sp. F-380]|uniref:Uncharacterized protein n=1 Tax=Flavobacterium kayseriense TaxID=2764714 RepID=A0ABR7JAA1_9FLAO|nr:hypothetical protein [Flavobacterium kayseriense]MBC5842463.1 hypothetical protein [Flavobacterium kayseriense]MBC5848993.1 hypothetical protein [Flavobacterium kayseriense]